MAKIQKGRHIHAPCDTYRILVLDGKDGHMSDTVKACKRAGHEVVACHTIREAFEFLDSKDHVDAFVTEAFMEDESVFDFLKAAKSDETHKDAPILILAAEPSKLGMFFAPSVAQAAELLGAYKFLVMPKFDIELLIHEIDAMLPHDKLPMKEADPDGAY